MRTEKQQRNYENRQRQKQNIKKKKEQSQAQRLKELNNKASKNGSMNRKRIQGDKYKTYFTVREPYDEPYTIYPKKACYIKKKYTESISSKFESMCRILDKIYNHIDKDKIIRSMPITDFFRTQYWSIIKQYRLTHSKGKCQRCKDAKAYNVIFKSFDNLGNIHNNLKDLQVVCNICYQEGIKSKKS